MPSQWSLRECLGNVAGKWFRQSSNRRMQRDVDSGIEKIVEQFIPVFLGQLLVFFAIAVNCICLNELAWHNRHNAVGFECRRELG